MRRNHICYYECRIPRAESSTLHLMTFERGEESNVFRWRAWIRFSSVHLYIPNLFSAYNFLYLLDLRGILKIGERKGRCTYPKAHNKIAWVILGVIIQALTRQDFNCCFWLFFFIKTYCSCQICRLETVTCFYLLDWKKKERNNTHSNGTLQLPPLL